MVALAGVPTLSAGGRPSRPATNGSGVGYETVSELISKPATYFFCVGTFSQQGCDAILTVLFTEESRPLPVAKLRRYEVLFKAFLQSQA